MDINENMIEFISGQRSMCCTFSNGKHIRKLKKLYSEHPEDFKYFKENTDGSVCANLPLKYLKISAPRKSNREYTAEERAAIAERLAKYRKGGGKNK